MIHRLRVGWWDARRPGEPPLQPGRLPLVGDALAFGRDPIAYLRACRRRHGDVFTTHIGRRRMTFFLDAAAYPALLRSADVLRLDEIRDEVSVRALGVDRAAIGQIDAAEVHALYERLQGDHLAALVDRTQLELEAVLAGEAAAGWRREGLYAFVDRVVFTATARVLFGADFPADAACPFHRFDAVFPFLVAGVPARLFPGVAQARRRLAALLDVDRGDASPFVHARRSYLATRAGRRDASRMQLGVLWAAVANTIPAAFWTLAHVLHDATARAAVEEEVRAVAS
jgi:hypothetical protein